MTSGGDALREHVARDHHISLRRQLAAGLEAAIRDGHLPAGSKLPSTRDLARRLRLSRDTVGAAYRRLRTRGFVTGRSGGRLCVHPAVGSVRVIDPPTGRVREVAGPDQIADGAIASALEGAYRLGLPRKTVLARLESSLARAGDRRSRGVDAGSTAVVADTHALATESRPTAAESLAVARERTAIALGSPDIAAGPPRLALLEPRPGLREALAEELGARLKIAVAATGVPRARAAGCPTLIRRELLPGVRRITARSPAGHRWPIELIPFGLAGGTRERGVVRRVVPYGVVALVSVSRAVRRFATELAAREFDRGLSFVAIDPADARAVEHDLTGVRIVLCDAASRKRLAPRLSDASVIRLVADRDIAALAAYLGVDPRAARNLNGSGGLRILDGPFRPS